MRALTFDSSRENWAASTGMVLDDVPEPALGQGDDHQVLIRVKYAGFCGSDRGIWSRKAFGDMVLGSLDQEGRTRRIFGHEMLGEEIAEAHDKAPPVACGVTQFSQHRRIELGDLELDERGALILEHRAFEQPFGEPVVGQHAVLVLVIG